MVRISQPSGQHARGTAESTVHSPRFTDHGAHSTPSGDAEARSAGDGTDIGGVVTGAVEPLPPPPPYLPAWELTIRQAGLGAPLGLTQFSRGRYIGAASYLQPALELADGTIADEIRWYLGIAHHRTVARAEAYRLWDIVCEGDSQFSATACETLGALRAHDARLRRRLRRASPVDR